MSMCAIDRRRFDVSPVAVPPPASAHHLAALSYYEVAGWGLTPIYAVRHYLSETGTGAELRTPACRAANRACWARLVADMIADIRMLPPTRHATDPRGSVSAAHTHHVTKQIRAHCDTPYAADCRAICGGRCVLGAT